MNPDSAEQNNRQEGTSPDFSRRFNEAFERVQQELSQQIDQQIREIRSSGSSEEQEAKLKELGKEIRQRALQNIHQQEEKSRQPQLEGEQGKRLKQEKKQAEENMRKSLIEMTIAAKKGVEVAPNKKAQAVLQSLADKSLTEFDAGEILKNLHPYLLGDKEIVISTANQEDSDFIKAVSFVQTNNPEAAQKVIESLVENAAQFGKQEGEIREKWASIIKQENSEDLNRVKEALAEQFTAFTSKQREFLFNLQSPELFLKHIEEQIKHVSHEKKEEIKKQMVDVYKKHYEKDPAGEELVKLVDRQVRIEVSGEIANGMLDIYNQLYARLNIEYADKSFDEIEKEDFMHGIEMARNYIYRALQHLEVDFRERLKENPDDPKLIKLFTTKEQKSYVQELTIDGQVRAVPRLRPIPYKGEVNLADYVTSLIRELGQWRQKTSYLHDAKYLFGLPPHEGSFYKGLGDFAEKIKGISLDEIMNLPDGKIIIDGLRLYEKLLDEEYAVKDWRIQSNMFMNKLGEINTQLDKDLIDYLKLKYPDVSEARILSAKNNAVGMARAIFLTEPEKNAYADPVDAKGTGYFASYGTNDAASLNVFNPLHTILRWQGEPNFNQIYFMPLGGKGRGGWDHRQMIENMSKYKDSFLKLKTGREGKEGRNLLIDEILNISKVAGVYQRGGWRDFYQFESHYVYDEKKEGIKLLDSFKAMDVLGYEAIKYFLKNFDDPFYNFYKKGYLKAKEGTPEANQREELFQYIFKRYFQPFTKISYQEYFSDLRNKAKDKVNEILKEKGTLSASDFETSVRLETSNLFIKRTNSRVVALRFPTKFLRIDRDRYHESGISRWREVYELMKKNGEVADRNEFNVIMKDLNFAEMLLRSENSDLIEKSIALDHPSGEIYLGNYDELMKNFTEGKISELLTAKGLEPGRIKKALSVYKLIQEKYLAKEEFLNGEALKAIEEYPFTFGLEDTDLRMIAFRGTGPRMIARQIKDLATMEEKVINGLFGIPKMLKEMAIDGKQDFSPMIKYLLDAQSAFRDVHGAGPDYEYVYKIAGMVVNYFKKDTMAKPLFGLLRFGKINSIAAEYAGRSSAVWEWDSRDIDRFAIALESYNLLPKKPYDKSKSPTYEDNYINIFGKPVKFGRKQKADWDWNSRRWREEFGGNMRDMTFDMVNQFLPLATAFLLWKYIKDAMDEVSGKKK
jgi:hypothetical protein